LYSLISINYYLILYLQVITIFELHYILKEYGIISYNKNNKYFHINIISFRLLRLLVFYKKFSIYH